MRGCPLSARGSVRWLYRSGIPPREPSGASALCLPVFANCCHFLGPDRDLNCPVRAPSRNLENHQSRARHSLATCQFLLLSLLALKPPTRGDPGPSQDSQRKLPLPIQRPFFRKIAPTFLKKSEPKVAEGQKSLAV